MDSEAVVEFLGQVPLLQRLPSCSLRKIAEVVEFKHYDTGDHVIREGQDGNGIYFIWNGEAEVSCSVNAEEGNPPEYQLKQYDYFGYGDGDSIHEVNVVALSKLTCLVLQRQNINLLKPNSIWNADESPETYSMVEHILRLEPIEVSIFVAGLNLEPIEVDIFRGFTLPGAPVFRQVFGGQFLGQALAAASKTVDCLKLAHSLHACFIIAGDAHLPIIYQVHRIRDGKSFATRRVDATQHGSVVFTMLVSFQKEEPGFERQETLMPPVPNPERLLSMEELRERRLTNPRLPINYRNTVARREFTPWPIEIRFFEPSNSTKKYGSEPSLMYWFKARGKLSDDTALHRCVVAYASDLILLDVSLNPHREKGLKTRSLSLDHSIWFHRDCRADDWLLYVIESPSTCGGRGFCSGRMFNRKGELVVSLIQEGLIRKAISSNQAPKSKL